MAIEIKRISKFDGELLISLFLKIGVRDFVPNGRFFEDQANILLVAYCDAQPCGFLYGYLLEEIKRESRKLFLYSIDVFESDRRIGVGTALVNALKLVAQEYSCSEIFVITNKSNVPAVKLYESTGGLAEHDDDIVFIYS